MIKKTLRSSYKSVDEVVMAHYYRKFVNFFHFFVHIYVQVYKIYFCVLLFNTNTKLIYKESRLKLFILCNVIRLIFRSIIIIKENISHRQTKLILIAIIEAQ